MCLVRLIECTVCPSAGSYRSGRQVSTTIGSSTAHSRMRAYSRLMRDTSRCTSPSSRTTVVPSFSAMVRRTTVASWSRVPTDNRGRIRFPPAASMLRVDSVGAEAGRLHNPDGPVGHRRHLGDQEDRNHGGDPLRAHRPARVGRPFAGRRGDPRRRVLAQLPHSGGHQDLLRVPPRHPARCGMPAPRCRREFATTPALQPQRRCSREPTWLPIPCASTVVSVSQTWMILTEPIVRQDGHIIPRPPRPRRPAVPDRPTGLAGWLDRCSALTHVPPCRMTSTAACAPRSPAYTPTEAAWTIRRPVSWGAFLHTRAPLHHPAGERC